MKLKKGDRVEVLAGKDRGKEGEVVRVFPTTTRCIVDGVNIAKKHQKAARADRCRAASSTRTCRSTRRNVHARAQGQADARRLPVRERRHEGPRLPASAGGDLMSTRPKPRRPRRGSSRRYHDEVQAAAARATSASATSCRCRGSRRSSSTWASAGPRSSRRCSRARSPTSPSSPARSRSSPRPRSRSPASSSARATSIGAKVTLRGDRMWEFFDRLVSVAIPRIRDFRGLPANELRRPRQLHVRRHRAADLPGDRLRQDRRPAGMDITIVTTADDQRRRARHCSMRSASRSSGSRRDAPRSSSAAGQRSRGKKKKYGRASNGQEGTDQQANAKPKFKVRGYTRCRRCGRPRSVYRKFGLCRICLREHGPRRRDPRRDEGELVRERHR